MNKATIEIPDMHTTEPTVGLRWKGGRLQQAFWVHGWEDRKQVARTEWHDVPIVSLDADDGIPAKAERPK